MQRRDVDAVLRQVGEDIGRFDTERVESARVAGKGLAQVEVASMRFEVAAQCRPGFRLIAAGSVHRFVHQSVWIIASSLAASAAKARMPSASLSVAIASSLSA